MAIKVTLNLRGLNRLMTSRGVSDRVRREAQRMAASAGEGFESVVAPHPWTARAYVRTADGVGRKRQSDEKVLERVVSEKS